ncbi:MAG: hypothetical protein WDM78_21680 [Puia sp.]
MSSPDIRHKARPEKAAENIIQHLHFLKVRMMPVGKIAGYSNGSLYTFGIIGYAIFFFFRRKNSDIAFIRFDRTIERQAS